ncbi:hypothetical protein C0J52_26863 [Blattella germanica]|nr:hypothetical protein C0J52_26863 [Blattella germanica]
MLLNSSSLIRFYLCWIFSFFFQYAYCMGRSSRKLSDPKSFMDAYDRGAGRYEGGGRGDMREEMGVPNSGGPRGNMGGNRGRWGQERRGGDDYPTKRRLCLIMWETPCLSILLWMVKFLSEEWIFITKLQDQCFVVMYCMLIQFSRSLQRNTIAEIRRDDDDQEQDEDIDVEEKVGSFVYNSRERICSICIIACGRWCVSLLILTEGHSEEQRAKQAVMIFRSMVTAIIVIPFGLGRRT